MPLGGDDLELGPLLPGEFDALFELFRQIVDAREGYPQAPPLTQEAYEQAWHSPTTATIAGRLDGVLVAAYYLKPNFPGRGAHIANAGYMVQAEMRGRGIGRAIVEDSIERAPLLGFDAIQFNLVFESNPARTLYERLGWRQVGRVPQAIDGEDAVIYWRSVAEGAS